MGNYKSKYLSDYIFIPDAIARSANLSPGAKICFGLLQYYRPDIETLNIGLFAENMAATEKEFKRYLKELQDNGNLEFKENGNFNLYITEK